MLVIVTHLVISAVDAQPMGAICEGILFFKRDIGRSAGKARWP